MACALWLTFLLLQVANEPASGDVPLAQLELNCGVSNGDTGITPLWSPGAQGATGGRRFWRSSKAVRAATIKARQDKDLASEVSFELKKGVVVGQAGPCEFVDSILRLQIYEPVVQSSGPPRTGWVTLSAELKGGPRFFVEVPFAEIEQSSNNIGLQVCTAEIPGVEDLRALQVKSNEVGKRACTGKDAGPLCGVPPSPALGNSVVINVAGGFWNQLFVPPHSEKLWLVVSFTPWCKRCESIINMWEHLAKHSFGRNLHFAVLNCHASADFCTILNLPGHPLLTAIYGGGDSRVHDAISAWSQDRDSSEISWLPRNWTFGELERVTTLLQKLPESFSPRVAANNSLPPAAHCPRAVGVAKLSESQTEGLDVGSGWTSHSDFSANASSDPAAPANLSASTKSKESLPGALRMLVSSLEHTRGTSIGIRWLAAVELWLKAAEQRIPGTLLGVAGALAELRNYVSAQLDRTLVLGGNHALCNSEWSRRTEPLRDAVKHAWPQGGNLNTSRKCSSRCNAWALFHGLAAVNVSIIPFSGLDLLNGLWALLAAEAANLSNASSNDNPGGLHAALGLKEAALLRSAINESKYGLAEALAASSTWTNSSAALLLWRAHAAVTANAALACTKQNRAIPDLRWPPSKLCTACWRKCFRQRRFCWEPWEEQRLALGLAQSEKDAFEDAIPNDDAVSNFLSDRYSWAFQSHPIEQSV